MLIFGCCHCRNISFSLEWEPSPTEIIARSCGCSFCIKQGGVWTSKASGVLKISIKELLLVTKYAFATQTAQFHICSRCGVTAVATSRIDGQLYAVVNVNAFEGVESSLLRYLPASFAEESEGVRLARRKQNWIGDVEFVESGCE